MTAFPHLLHRYPSAESFASGLALDEDLVDLAYGLTSRGVVEQLLRRKHGLSANEARRRSSGIAAHVRQGLAFWTQARSGPRGLAFLPYYYGFLQFAKAVILARGGPQDQRSMLTHGLSYPTTLKSSRSIDSEVVKVWPKGVFGEYYHVLVGEALPDFRRKKNRQKGTAIATIQMDSVYPFVLDSSYEYGRAVGGISSFLEVAIRRVAEADGVRRFSVETGNQTVNRSMSPLLRVPPVGSSEFSCDVGTHPIDTVPTYLLWLPLSVEKDWSSTIPITYATPRWNGRLKYAEEVPLFLAFFHLGSVVRYKPTFLESVMDSRYLPFLRALERHGSTKILLLFINSMYDVSHVPG